MVRPRFHLAFQATDLAATEAFFVEQLGCLIGRRSERWVDFDFFGHQITAHRCDASPAPIHNPVDGDQVPVPHFGLILEWQQWHELAQRLEGQVTFVINPHIRFEGQAGEQATMFIREPSGNYLEFKAFQDDSHIFDQGA